MRHFNRAPVLQEFIFAAVLPACSEPFSICPAKRRFFICQELTVGAQRSAADRPRSGGRKCRAVFPVSVFERINSDSPLHGLAAELWLSRHRQIWPLATGFPSNRTSSEAITSTS